MSIVQELLKQIETWINGANLEVDFSKKGEIVELRDGVATAVCRAPVRLAELVTFQHGLKGLVLDLSSEWVGVLILGEPSSLEQGDTVLATGQIFQVWVGEEYLWRVLDGLGQPVDEWAPIIPKHFWLVEKVAPGVISRKSVSVPLETWIKAIDAMVPIGRGQIDRPEKLLSLLIRFSTKNEKMSIVSMLLSDKKNEKSEESLKCSKKNERWTILS